MEGVRVDGQIGWVPFNRERHARREDKALRSIVFLRDDSACDRDFNGLRADGEGLFVDGVLLALRVRVDELHLIRTGIGLLGLVDRLAVLRDLEAELVLVDRGVLLALGGLDVDRCAGLLGKDRAPRLAVIFGAERVVGQIVAELERVVLAVHGFHKLHRHSRDLDRPVRSGDILRRRSSDRKRLADCILRHSHFVNAACRERVIAKRHAGRKIALDQPALRQSFRKAVASAVLIIDCKIKNVSGRSIARRCNDRQSLGIICVIAAPGAKCS